MSYSLTKSKKTWFHSPIVAVVLVVIVILGGLSVARAFAKEREAASLRNQYRRELQGMHERETELSQQIENLSTERGLEAEIRERYRVAKPGEQLVVVVDNGAGDDADNGEKSFWMKLRMFVGL